jgi:mono/diheme cytochrome c family protein
MRSRLLVAALVVMCASVPSIASSQGHTHGQQTDSSSAPPATKTPPPIKATMEQLHRSGGVPQGWKFLMPPGNPAEGKKAFVTLECYRCHEVKGEDFPNAKKPGDVGPELTGMGAHHPAEYFAESIVNPNRVIIQGPGYTGPDGLSKMPDYSESLTVRQLVDLVAYLKSLQGGSMKEMKMK